MNQAPANPLLSLLPLLLIFVVFYFILIWPMQRKQKKHQQFLAQLKRGDKVITNGGIYGTIHAVNHQTVILKVGDGVKLKVSRSAIAGFQPLEGGEDG